MEHQSIDLFDEVLRLSWLDQATRQEPEANAHTMQYLLAIEEATHPDKGSLQRIRARLLPHLVTPSLGELLAQALQPTGTEKVAAITGLPITMVEQLRKDRLYPTQVPVMLMMRLLKWLQIPFDQATIALRKTGERFSQLMDVHTSKYGTMPVGRRATRDELGTSIDLTRKGRDLYVNEKALLAYLNRLEQEMVANL